jgi:glycosyltransferase involved in cell wall biosynthesis
VQTIYNPLDLKTIDAQSQIPLPNWVKFDYIVGVGRYHNQKGFDWLIQALVQLPQDIHLVLVGDGPERESLTQLAKNLSLEDRVHLVGFDTNPFRWMKRSRCFVLSSRYEGFGIVVAEALAVGVPVVSMNCPFGPEEILQQGKVGELVKLGDVDGMAAAIQRVLEADESENKVMRQQRAADFAVDKIAEAYLRLALPEAINQ